MDVNIRKILTVAAVVMLAATVIYVYYNFNPSVARWFPRCPSKAITGYDCPGCGTQRALHALLHGDFAASLRYNALLVPALFMSATMAFAERTKLRHPRFHRALTGNVAIAVVVAVMVLWTVVRNLLPVNQVI